MNDVRPLPSTENAYLGTLSLVAVCYALAISGYPIWAGIAGLVGQDDNRLVTILYRMAVAILSIWVFAQAADRRTLWGDLAVFAASAFWIVYLIRIAVDGYVHHLILPLPAYEVLVSAVLLAIVPALVGLIYPSRNELLQARNLVALAILIALILVWVDSRQAMLQPTFQSQDRLAIGKLNPIGVGKIAGSLFLIAIAALYGGIRPRTSSGRIAWVLMALLGLAFMLMAASKGPILSVLAGLMVFALVPPEPKRVAIMVLVVISVVMLSVLANDVIDRYLGFNFLYRFIFAFEYTAYDTSSMDRIVAFNGAWQQFLESPFWGDSIIERHTNYYPHNSVLEALMATGVLGTVPFLAVTIISLVAAFRLIAWHAGQEWIGLLTVQYFIDTLTTGTHWGNAQVWLLMMAVIAIARSYKTHLIEKEYGQSRGSPTVFAV